MNTLRGPPGGLDLDLIYLYPHNRCCQEGSCRKGLMDSRALGCIGVGAERCGQGAAYKQKK